MRSFGKQDNFTCPYCGELIQGEPELLVCPECGREGCDSCMPGGVGVICPECEDKKELDMGADDIFIDDH